MQIFSYIMAPLCFFAAGILVSIISVRKVQAISSPSIWDYVALLCAIVSGIFFISSL